MSGRLNNIACFAGAMDCYYDAAGPAPVSWRGGQELKHLLNRSPAVALVN